MRKLCLSFVVSQAAFNKSYAAKSYPITSQSHNHSLETVCRDGWFEGFYSFRRLKLKVALVKKLIVLLDWFLINQLKLVEVIQILHH